MTYLSALLGLVAVAMMATLVLLAVRRDRAIRRNAPGSVVERRPRAATLGARAEGGQSPPSAVR